MMIQNIKSNVRQRVGAAGQIYRGLRKTCRDTQRQAVTVVARKSRSVANTEVGAAKNVCTSARAAFERARADGVNQVVRQPRRYVPAGRKQTAAAYRATLELLSKTRGELSDVAAGSYREMSAQLRGAPAADAAQASESKVATAAPQQKPQAEPARTPRKKAARRSTAGSARPKKKRAPRTKTAASPTTNS